MALTITAASVGAPPVELAGPAAPTGAGDAFAGVLAGIGQADRPRAQRDEPSADQTDTLPDADQDSAAAAELAVLVLGAVPAAQPVPAPPAGTGSASGDEPGATGGVQAEHTRGPAPQAAQAAQDAAARRPAQALAAQAAATAAKQARFVDHSSGGPAGTQPTPASGPAAGSAAVPELAAGLGPALGHGAAEVAVPPIGSTLPASNPLSSNLPGSNPDASTLTAGTPTASPLNVETLTTSALNVVTQPAPTPLAPVLEASPALAAQLAAAQAASAGTGAHGSAASPVQQDNATPAVVTLPGIAAAIAGTSGAAKATDQAAGGRSAQVVTPAAGRRAEAAPRAGHGRPEDPAPILAPSLAADPSTPAQPGTQAPPGTQAQPGTQAPPGTLPVQAPGPTTGPAAQPTGHDAGPVQRHPAADLPLTSQVAGPVLALRARGDGSHQLLIALHPAELGPVNVHVRIAGDAMTISLASSSDGAHDTLRDALPQLRSELQAAGLGSASLSLDLTSGGSAGSGGFTAPRQDTGPSHPAPAPTAEPPRRQPSTRSTTTSTSGLDRWL